MAKINIPKNVDGFEAIAQVKEVLGVVIATNSHGQQRAILPGDYLYEDDVVDFKQLVLFTPQEFNQHLLALEEQLLNDLDTQIAAEKEAQLVKLEAEKKAKLANDDEAKEKETTEEEDEGSQFTVVEHHSPLFGDGSETSGLQARINGLLEEQTQLRFAKKVVDSLSKGAGNGKSYADTDIFVDLSIKPRNTDTFESKLKFIEEMTLAKLDGFKGKPDALTQYYESITKVVDLSSIIQTLFDAPKDGKITLSWPVIVGAGETLQIIAAGQYDKASFFKELGVNDLKDLGKTLDLSQIPTHGLIIPNINPLLVQEGLLKIGGLSAANTSEILNKFGDTDQDIDFSVKITADSLKTVGKDGISESGQSTVLFDQQLVHLGVDAVATGAVVLSQGGAFSQNFVNENGRMLDKSVFGDLNGVTAINDGPFKGIAINFAGFFQDMDGSESRVLTIKLPEGLGLDNWSYGGMLSNSVTTKGVSHNQYGAIENLESQGWTFNADKTAISITLDAKNAASLNSLVLVNTPENFQRMQIPNKPLDFQIELRSTEHPTDAEDKTNNNEFVQIFHLRDDSRAHGAPGGEGGPGAHGGPGADGILGTSDDVSVGPGADGILGTSDDVPGGPGGPGADDIPGSNFWDDTPDNGDGGGFNFWEHFPPDVLENPDDDSAGDDNVRNSDGSYALKEYTNNNDYRAFSVRLNSVWDLLSPSTAKTQLFDFSSLKDTGSLKITLTDIADPKELPTLKLEGVSPSPTFIKTADGHYVYEVSLSKINGNPASLKIIPSAFDSHDFKIAVDVVSTDKNVPSIKLLSDSVVHVGVEAQSMDYTEKHDAGEGSVYTFSLDNQSIEFSSRNTVSFDLVITPYLQDQDGSESQAIKVYLPTGAEKSVASWSLNEGGLGWKLGNDARGPYVEYHGTVQSETALKIPVTLDGNTYAALQAGKGGNFNVVWETIDKDSDSSDISRAVTDTANARDGSGGPGIIIDPGFKDALKGLSISEVQDTHQESNTIPVPLGELFTQIKYLLNGISPVITAKIADAKDSSIHPDAVKVSGAANKVTKEIGDINNRLHEIFDKLELHITQISTKDMLPVTLWDDNGQKYALDASSSVKYVDQRGADIFKLSSEYGNDTLFKLFKDFLTSGSPADYSVRLEPTAHSSVGFDLKFEVELGDIKASALTPVSAAGNEIRSYASISLPPKVVLDTNSAHVANLDAVKSTVEKFNDDAGTVRVSIDTVATDVNAKVGLVTAVYTEYARGVDSKTGDLKLIEKSVPKELPLFQIKDDTVHMPLAFKLYVPERDGTESVKVRFTLPDSDDLLKAKELGKVDFVWEIESPNNGWTLKNTDGVFTIERDVSGEALLLLEKLHTATDDAAKEAIRHAAKAEVLQEIEGLQLDANNNLISNVPLAFDRDLLSSMVHKPMSIGMHTEISDTPNSAADFKDDNIKTSDQQFSFNYDKRFLDPTITEFSFDPETFGEKELELAIARHQVVQVDLREMIKQIDEQYKALKDNRINENGESIKSLAELEQAQTKFFENTKIVFETFTSGGKFPEGKAPIAFFNTTPVELEVTDKSLSASGQQLKALYESITRDSQWEDNLESLPKLYLASAPYYDKDFSINATSYVNGKLDNQITLLETTNYTVDSQTQSALDLELGGARQVSVSPRMEFETIAHNQNADLFDLAGNNAQSMKAVKFTFDVSAKFPDVDGSESHWIVIKLDTSKLLYPPFDAEGNEHPKAGLPIGDDFEATSYIFQKEDTLWGNYGHGVFARRIDHNTQEDFDESFSFEVPLSMVPVAVQEGHSSLYKYDEFGNQVLKNGQPVLADDVFGIKFDLASEDAGFSQKGITDFELNQFDNIDTTHLEKTVRIETIGIDERTNNDALTNQQRKDLASDEGQWKVADVSFEGAMEALWQKFHAPLAHLQSAFGIDSKFNVLEFIKNENQAEQAIYQKLLDSKIEISVGLIDKLHLPDGYFESVDANFSYDGSGHYTLTGNDLATALVQWNHGEDQIITDIDGNLHTVPHLEPTMYFRSDLYNATDFSVSVKAFDDSGDKPFYNPSDVLVIVDGEAQAVNPAEKPAGATHQTGIDTHLSFGMGSDGELNGQADLNVQVNINMLDHDNSEDVEVTLTLHGNLPFEKLLLLQAQNSHAVWTQSLSEPNVFTARVPANSAQTLSDSFVLRGKTADFISSDAQGGSVSGEKITFDMRIVTHEKMEDYQVHNQSSDPNAVLEKVSTISTQRTPAGVINVAEKTHDYLVDVRSAFKAIDAQLKSIRSTEVTALEALKAAKDSGNTAAEAKLLKDHPQLSQYLDAQGKLTVTFPLSKDFFTEGSSYTIKLPDTLKLPTELELKQNYTIQLTLPKESDMLTKAAPKDLNFQWVDSKTDAWQIVTKPGQPTVMEIKLSSTDIKDFNTFQASLAKQDPSSVAESVQKFLGDHPHFNNLIDESGHLSVTLPISGEMRQYLDESNAHLKDVSITSTISQKEGAAVELIDSSVNQNILNPSDIHYTLSPTVALKDYDYPSEPQAGNQYLLNFQVNLDFSDIHDSRPIEVKIPLPRDTQMLSGTDLLGGLDWSLPSGSGWHIVDDSYVVKEFSAAEIKQLQFVQAEKMAQHEPNATVIDFPALQYHFVDEVAFDLLNNLSNVMPAFSVTAMATALEPNDHEAYTNALDFSVNVDLATVSATQSVTIRIDLPPENSMLNSETVTSESGFSWKVSDASSGWQIDSATHQLVKVLSQDEIKALKDKSSVTDQVDIKVPLAYTSQYADDVKKINNLAFNYTATKQEAPIIGKYTQAAEISENQFAFNEQSDHYLDKVKLTFSLEHMQIIGQDNTSGKLPAFDVDQLLEGLHLSKDKDGNLPDGLSIVQSETSPSVTIEGAALKAVLADWLQLHDSHAPITLLLDGDNGQSYYFNGSLQYDDATFGNETADTHLVNIFDQVDITKIGQETIAAGADSVPYTVDLTRGFVELYKEYIEPHRDQVAFSLEDQMQVLQAQITQALGQSPSVEQINNYLKNMTIDLHLGYSVYESKPAILQLIKHTDLPDSTYGKDSIIGSVTELKLVQTSEFISVPVGRNTESVMIDGIPVFAKTDPQGGKYIEVRDSLYQISGKDLADIYQTWSSGDAHNNNASILINGYNNKPFTLDAAIVNTGAVDDRGNSLSLSSKEYVINTGKSSTGKSLGSDNVLSFNDMIDVLHPEFHASTVSVKLDTSRDLIKPPEIMDDKFEKIFLGKEINEKGESVSIYEYQLKGDDFEKAFDTWLSQAMTDRGGFNASAKFSTTVQVYQPEDFTIDARVEHGLGPDRESTGLYADTIIQVGARDDILVSEPGRESFDYVKEVGETEVKKVSLDLSKAFKLLAEKFVVNGAFSPENILNSEIRISIIGGGKVDGEGPSIVSPGMKKLDAGAASSKLGFEEWVMTNPDSGKQGQTSNASAVSHNGTLDIIDRFQKWLKASGAEKESIQKEATTVELQLNEHRDEDIAIRYKLTYADGGDPVAFRPDQFVVVDAVVNGVKKDSLELEVHPPEFLQERGLSGLFKVSYTVKMDFPDQDGSEKHLVQLEIYDTDGKLINIPFKIFKDSADEGWQRGPNNTIVFDPDKIDVTTLENGHFEKTLDLRFDIDDLVNKGYLERSTDGAIRQLNFITNVKVTSTEDTAGLQVEELKPLEQSLLKLPSETSVKEFLSSSQNEHTQTTIRFASVNESLVEQTTVNAKAVPAAQRLREYYEDHKLAPAGLKAETSDSEIGIVNISSIYSKINASSKELLKNDQWFEVEKLLSDLKAWKDSYIEQHQKDNPVPDPDAALSKIKITLNVDSLNPKTLNAELELPGAEKVSNTQWTISAKTLLDTATSGVDPLHFIVDTGNISTVNVGVTTQDGTPVKFEHNESVTASLNDLDNTLDLQNVFEKVRDGDVSLNGASITVQLSSIPKTAILPPYFEFSADIKNSAGAVVGKTYHISLNNLKTEYKDWLDEQSVNTTKANSTPALITLPDGVALHTTSVNLTYKNVYSVDSQEEIKFNAYEKLEVISTDKNGQPLSVTTAVDAGDKLLSSIVHKEYYPDLSSVIQSIFNKVPSVGLILNGQTAATSNTTNGLAAYILGTKLDGTGKATLWTPALAKAPGYNASDYVIDKAVLKAGTALGTDQKAFSELFQFTVTINGVTTTINLDGKLSEFTNLARAYKTYEASTKTSADSDAYQTVTKSFIDKLDPDTRSKLIISVDAEADRNDGISMPWTPPATQVIFSLTDKISGTSYSQTGGTANTVNDAGDTWTVTSLTTPTYGHAVTPSPSTTIAFSKETVDSTSSNFLKSEAIIDFEPIVANLLGKLPPDLQAAYITGTKVNADGSIARWSPDQASEKGWSIDTAKDGTGAQKAFTDFCQVVTTITTMNNGTPTTSTITLDLNAPGAAVGFSELARAYLVEQSILNNPASSVSDKEQARTVFQAETKEFLTDLAASGSTSAASLMKIFAHTYDTVTVNKIEVIDKLASFNQTNATTLDSSDDSWAAATATNKVTLELAAPNASNHGLQAQYYKDSVSWPATATAPEAQALNTKLEANLNFAGVAEGAFGDGLIVGLSTIFSARWTGQLLADKSGAYQLQVKADAGSVVEVWIGGSKIGALSGTIPSAGVLNLASWTPPTDSDKKYDIEVRYKDVSGGSDGISLNWKEPGATSSAPFVAIPPANLTPPADSILTKTMLNVTDYYQTTLNLNSIFEKITDKTHQKIIVTLEPENILNKTDVVFLQAFKPTDNPNEWEINTDKGSLYENWQAAKSGTYVIDLVVHGDLETHIAKNLTLKYEIQQSEHITLDEYNQSLISGGEGIRYAELGPNSGSFDLQDIFKAIRNNGDFDFAGSKLQVTFDTVTLSNPLPSYLSVETSVGGGTKTLSIKMDSTVIKNLYADWEENPDEPAVLPNFTINSPTLTNISASLTYSNGYQANDLTDDMQVLLNNFDSLVATDGKRFDNGTKDGISTTPLQQQLWGVLSSNYEDNQSQFKKFVIVFESSDPSGPLDESLIAQAVYVSPKHPNDVYSWLSDIKSVHAPLEAGETSVPNNRYAYEITLDMKEYQDALEAARADAKDAAVKRNDPTTTDSYYTGDHLADKFLNDFSTTMVNSLFLPVREGARLSNLSIQAVNEDNQMVDPVTGRLTDVHVTYDDVPLGNAFTLYGKEMGVDLGQVLWDALEAIANNTDGISSQVLASNLKLHTNINTQLVFGHNTTTEWPQDDYTNPSTTVVGADAAAFQRIFSSMKLTVPGTDTVKTLGAFSPQEFKNLSPNEYPLSLLYPYTTNTVPKGTANNAATFKDESNPDDWFVSYDTKFIQNHVLDGELLKVLVNQVQQIIDKGPAGVAAKADFIEKTLGLFSLQAPPKTGEDEHGNTDAFVLNVETRSQVVHDTAIDGGTSKFEYKTDVILPDTFIDIVPTENRSLDASSNLSVKIDNTFEDKITDASGNVIRVADDNAHTVARSKMDLNLDLQFVNRSSELKHGIVIELPRYFTENGQRVEYNWAFLNSPNTHASLQGDSTTSQGGRPWNLLDDPKEYKESVLLHYFFPATTDGKITDTLSLTFDAEVLVNQGNASLAPIQDQIILYTSSTSDDKPAKYYDINKSGDIGLLAVDSSVVPQDIIKDTTFITPTTLSLKNDNYTAKAGTEGDDNFRLTDDSKNTALFTGKGNDTVYGGDGQDIVIESRSTAGGNDYVVLGGGADIGATGAGDDVIYANGDKSSTGLNEQGRSYFIFEGDTLAAAQKVSFEIHFEINGDWNSASYYKSYYANASFSDFPLVTSTHQNTVLEKVSEGKIEKRATEIVDLISAGTGNDIIYTHNPNLDKYHGAFVLAGQGKDTIVSGWGSDVINLSIANGLKMVTKEPILTSDFWGEAAGSLGSTRDENNILYKLLDKLGFSNIGGYNATQIIGNIGKGHYASDLTGYFNDGGSTNDVFDDEPGNVRTALNKFIEEANKLFDDKYTGNSEQLIDIKAYNEDLKKLNLLKDYSNNWDEIEGTGQKYAALHLTSGDDAMGSTYGKDAELKQSDHETDVIRYYLDSVVKDVAQDNQRDFAGANRSFDTIYYFDTNKDTGDKIDLSGFFNELFKSHHQYEVQEQEKIDTLRAGHASEADIVKAVSAMRFEFIKVVGEDFENDLLQVSNKDRLTETTENTVSTADVALQEARTEKSARIIVTDPENRDDSHTTTTDNSASMEFRYDIALLVGVKAGELSLDNFILYTPQDLQ